MDGGPWTFNTNLLLFKPIASLDQASHIQLHDFEIWIQVHGLPFSLKSEWVLQHIGNHVGSFLTSDPKNFSEVWRSYFRVRVRLDVRRPLRAGMKIKKDGGSWLWLDFKYERLPTFCFLCGKIGHGENFCDKALEQGPGPSCKPFGSWLRATSRSSQINHGAQWLVEEVDGTTDSPAVNRASAIGIVANLGGKDVNSAQHGVHDRQHHVISAQQGGQERSHHVICAQHGGQVSNGVNDGYGALSDQRCNQFPCRGNPQLDTKEAEGDGVHSAIPQDDGIILLDPKRRRVGQNRTVLSLTT